MRISLCKFNHRQMNRYPDRVADTLEINEHVNMGEAQQMPKEQRQLMRNVGRQGSEK
jgi:hypothetical protein